MMNGQTARGVLMALGTALAWGGTGSFAKLIAAGGVSQLTVVCYRGFFAASVVGLFMLARRGSSFFRCTRAELAQYAALGVFTVLFNATGLHDVLRLPLRAAGADAQLHIPIVTMAEAR